MTRKTLLRTSVSHLSRDGERIAVIVAIFMGHSIYLMKFIQFFFLVFWCFFFCTSGDKLVNG